MTRKRSFDSLHPFDPEIDKTLNRIRISKNMHVGHSSGSFSSISEIDNFEIKPDISDNPLYEPEPMENNNRTLKELATPDYPQLELAQSYKLKSGLIHLLPKFHDLAGEDPHKHLKEFHMGCSMMRPNKRLAIFVAGYVQHMGRHEMAIPRKVLPNVQDSGHLERDMWNLAHSGKTLHEYWERFNKLCTIFHIPCIPSSRSRLHSHSGAWCYQRCISRSRSSDPLYDLDPGIELTLHRLRKVRNIVVIHSNLVTNTSDSVEYNSTNHFAESEQMENNDQTLKELATLDVVYQPWCIQRRSPQALERIPCGLFHNDAARDTRGLHQNESVPFSLDGTAKDWLYL
ncbi:hypothetical protein CR513_05810, partial [Mucuna pruriens]